MGMKRPVPFRSIKRQREGFLARTICDPLRENQPYAKMSPLFNGFRNIFAGSTVVENLKRISCSLTELRLLFMRFFLVVNIAKRKIISNSAIFFMFPYTYFPRDTFLRVKGYSISLIKLPRRVVLFPNLHFGGVATEQRE